MWISYRPRASATAINGIGVAVGSEAAVPAIRRLDLAKGVIDGVQRRAAHDAGKADTNREALDAESRVWRRIFLSSARAKVGGSVAMRKLRRSLKR